MGRVLQTNKQTNKQENKVCLALTSKEKEETFLEKKKDKSNPTL